MQDYRSPDEIMCIGAGVEKSESVVHYATDDAGMVVGSIADDYLQGVSDILAKGFDGLRITESEDGCKLENKD